MLMPAMTPSWVSWYIVTPGDTTTPPAALPPCVPCCAAAIALAPKLPAGVHQLIERVRGVEHEHVPEILHPEAKARLELEHFPVRDLLRGVVHGEAAAMGGATVHEFHSDIAEHRVAGSRLDRGARAGVGLVELCQCVVRHLLNGRS